MVNDTTATYEYVLLGGDISYANGHDSTWLTYLKVCVTDAEGQSWLTRSPSILTKIRFILERPGVGN
jgi:hypothetical protein